MTRDMKTEQLVLGVDGDAAGSADAIAFDARRRRQDVDGALDRRPVDPVLHAPTTAATATA